MLPSIDLVADRCQNRREIVVVGRRRSELLNGVPIHQPNHRQQIAPFEKLETQPTRAQHFTVQGRRPKKFIRAILVPNTPRLVLSILTFETGEPQGNCAVHG